MYRVLDQTDTASGHAISPTAGILGFCVVVYKHKQSLLRVTRSAREADGNQRRNFHLIHLNKKGHKLCFKTTRASDHWDR